MFYLLLCYKKNVDKKYSKLCGCESQTLSRWWKITDLVWEQCAEEDIWTCRGGNTERMEIITYFTVSWSILSPTTIMIKSRSIWCVRHVAFMGEIRNTAGVLVRNPEKQRPPESPRHRWKVMLQWTWEKQDWRVGIWPIRLRGQFSIRIIQTFGCLKRQQVYSLLNQLWVSMRQANFVRNSLCDVFYQDVWIFLRLWTDCSCLSD